ncbi:hypothetical protein LINPERHAP2_LOCUS4629, partial [Linum perenne]
YPHSSEPQNPTWQSLRTAVSIRSPCSHRSGPVSLLRRLSPVRLSLRCGGSSTLINCRARHCSLLCNRGVQGLLDGDGAFDSSSSPPANRIIALPQPNFLTDEDSRAFGNHNSAPATDLRLRVCGRVKF